MNHAIALTTATWTYYLSTLGITEISLLVLTVGCAIAVGVFVAMAWPHVDAMDQERERDEWLDMGEPDSTSTANSDHERETRGSDSRPS